MKEELRGRIEAVVQALHDADWHFSKAAIIRAVRNLLDIYGTQAGWPYIEENNYQIVVDCITSEKQQPRQRTGQMRSTVSVRETRASNVLDNSRNLSIRKTADPVMSEREETMCTIPSDHSPDSPDIRSHQRHLWSITCGLPNLPCFQDDAQDAVQGVLHLQDVDPGSETRGDQSRQPGAHEHGVEPVEKSDNAEAGNFNLDADGQVKIRRKRSRLTAGKGTSKRYAHGIGSRAGACSTEEKACEASVSVQGSGSPQHNIPSTVISDGSIQGAAASPSEIVGGSASDEQRCGSNSQAETQVIVECSPTEVVAQSFETPRQKHRKEVVQVHSNQRNDSDSFIGLAASTSHSSEAVESILPEVAGEADMKYAEGGSSQCRPNLNSGAPSVADLKIDSTIKEVLAVISSRTGLSGVELRVAPESGKVVSSKSGGSKKPIQSSLEGEEPKCIEMPVVAVEELVVEGLSVPVLTPVKEETLPHAVDLGNHETKGPQSSDPSTGKSIQARTACCVPDLKVAFSGTEEPLLVDGLSACSPCLPPGFEGKFACMVSEQDSTPCKDVVRGSSEKGNEHVMPQSFKGMAFSVDAGLQTTACSSNGKEHLGGNGSQTDSDDVPVSARAESKPLYSVVQATGSSDAYPMSHGVSPKTLHPVPPWPDSCLPSKAPEPTLESGAGQSAVGFPPHVKGALLPPGREMVQKSSFPGSTKGIAPHLKIPPPPAILPLSVPPDPLHASKYLNPSCPTPLYTGFAVPPGPCGVVIPSQAMPPPPRQQSPAAQRPLMDASKQKLAECSSGSTPVVHDKLVGQAMMTDAKVAGSSGENLTFSGGTTHLADPMRSFYIGNIPKGLEDTETAVKQLLESYLSTFEFVPQNIVRLEQLYMRERFHSHFAFAEFSVPKVAMIVRDACKFDATALVLRGTPLKVGRNNQDTTGEISFRESLVFQTRKRTLDPSRVIYIGNVPSSWQDEGKLKSYFTRILKGSDAHLSGDLVYAVYIYPAESDAYLELVSEALADALIYKCTKDPKLLDALSGLTFFCRHPKFVPLCAALFVRRPHALVNSMDATPAAESFQSILYIAKLPVLCDGYWTRRLRDLFEVVLGTLRIEKKISGTIRSFSWPPGRNFAYVGFDSEAVADAVMDQYIDKLQTFCIKDMPFCIFRHQDYIRPGAVYKNADRTARNHQPMGLSREMAGEERLAHCRRTSGPDFGHEGVEDEEFEEGEHRPEMRKRPRRETVHKEADAVDSASMKLAKQAKGNAILSGSAVGTTDCGSTTLHSELSKDAGGLKLKSKSSSLESNKVIRVRGLVQGLFEPAIKGALNELFERALCNSGLLEHHVHVIRSLDFVFGSSEASVCVQSCESADFLLACPAPMKLAGEILLLRPGKRHQGLDVEKNLAPLKHGKGVAQASLDSSWRKSQWDVSRGSRDAVVPPSSWGVDSLRRSSPRVGGPSSDSQVIRGLGPPLPPYAALHNHDYGRPPPPRAPPSLSLPPGYAESPSRAPPCLSPAPGYAEPPSGPPPCIQSPAYAEPPARAPPLLPSVGFAEAPASAPLLSHPPGYVDPLASAPSPLSLPPGDVEPSARAPPSLSPSPGYAEPAPTGGYDQFQRADSHLLKVGPGSEEGKQTEEGTSVPEPRSWQISPNRPPSLTPGKRAVPEFVGPHEYSNKKQKSELIKDVPAKKNTGGWLEDDDDDEVDGQCHPVVQTPTWLHEIKDSAIPKSGNPEPDACATAGADAKGPNRQSQEDSSSIRSDWKSKQSPGWQALEDKVKYKDPWPIREVRRSRAAHENGVAKSSWLSSMNLKNAGGSPARENDASGRLHCLRALDTILSGVKGENKPRASTEHKAAEGIQHILGNSEMRQAAVGSVRSVGLDLQSEHRLASLEAKVDMERKISPPDLSDSAPRKSPATQRNVLKFDLNEVLVESPRPIDGLDTIFLPEEYSAPPSTLPSHNSEDQLETSSKRGLEDESKVASAGPVPRRGEDRKSPRRCSQEDKRDDWRADKGDDRRDDRREEERDDRRVERREERRREEKREDRREERRDGRRDDRRDSRRDDRRDSKLDADLRSGHRYDRYDYDDRRSKYSSLTRSYTLPRPSGSRSGGGRSFDEDRQLYRRYRSFDEGRDHGNYRPDR